MLTDLITNSLFYLLLFLVLSVVCCIYACSLSSASTGELNVFIKSIVLLRLQTVCRGRGELKINQLPPATAVKCNKTQFNIFSYSCILYSCFTSTVHNKTTKPQNSTNTRRHFTQQRLDSSRTQYKR